YQDVELSHEAAIGKIKKEEIEYLASRGIPEEEAQAMIIRGFMNVEILGLPATLQKEIKKVTEKV
ncbi:MAG TPA: SufD family Fe-S cluster assembly protein, partial [bacterium]|nr:SufD family Fe-S cluster assembly protein [bacterium]